MADLLYDGLTLTWVTNGGKKYKATSGLPHGQNSKWQHLDNFGPIPEGLYRLHMVDAGTAVVGKDKDGSYVLNPPKDGGFQKVPHGVYDQGRNQDVWGNARDGGFVLWGNNRVQLTPIKFDHPNTSYRGGFFIHNSDKGSSHGCIEAQGQFFKDADAYRKRKNASLYLTVQVKYQSGDMITNGGTNGADPYAWSRGKEEKYHEDRRQKGQEDDPRSDPNYLSEDHAPGH